LGGVFVGILFVDRTTLLVVWVGGMFGLLFWFGVCGFCGVRAKKCWKVLVSEKSAG